LEPPCLDVSSPEPGPERVPELSPGRVPEPVPKYVPRGGYGIHRRDLGWLVPAECVPQTSEWSPKWGSDTENEDLGDSARGVET